MANQNYGFLSCPQDCNNPQAILQLFIDLVAEECAFKPTNIWSRSTKRKKKPMSVVHFVYGEESRNPVFKRNTGSSIANSIKQTQTI